MLGLEQRMNKYVCYPIQRRLPESVSPNLISLFNLFFTWIAFGLAAGAPYLTPLEGMFARIAAGFFIWGYMVTDNLDGIHARATGQTSRLGEFMDHGLDASNIPLVAATLVITIGLEPITLVFGIGILSLVFVSQLAQQNLTGRFEGNAGPDALVLVGASMCAIAVLLAFVPREAVWLDYLFNSFVTFCIAVAGGYVILYMRQCPQMLPQLAGFIGLSVLLGVLRWAEVLSDVGVSLLLVAVCFRTGASFVLSTMLDRKYSGFDPLVSIVIGVVVIAGAALPRGSIVMIILPGVALIVLAVKTVLDARRALAKTEAEAAAA
jgi:phosphatidylglycerophosphate synthase